MKEDSGGYNKSQLPGTPNTKTECPPKKLFAELQTSLSPCQLVTCTWMKEDSGGYKNISAAILPLATRFALAPPVPTPWELSSWLPVSLLRRSWRLAQAAALWPTLPPAVLNKPVIALAYTVHLLRRGERTRGAMESGMLYWVAWRELVALTAWEGGFPELRGTPMRVTLAAGAAREPGTGPRRASAIVVTHLSLPLSGFFQRCVRLLELEWSGVSRRASLRRVVWL